MISGARREGEVDGAREMHVVILDNGRSRQLGDPEFQAILHCIRCGACLNVCPVYRQVGGHAYGSVYSGPIGAVLSPRLSDEPKARELAKASSLCGACFEACPVEIPLHDMLVHERRRNVEARPGPSAERLAFRAWALLFSRAWLYRSGMRLVRVLRKRFFPKSAPRRLPNLPAADAWARYRALPVLAAESFRERLRAERRNVKG